KSNLTLKVHQAEWHVRGLTYHCRNLIRHYNVIAQDVSKRASVGADVVIMYEPAVQKLMFEFYALVNLARISLDNLRNLSPVFVTPYNQLPKSITNYKPGSTNCPIYERLAKEPILAYLVDIRNCIVHYRTFATSDNAIATAEGVEELPVLDEIDFTEGVAKFYFRYTGGKFVLNIYLPDVIFVRKPSGEKKLAEFTYKKRYNLLSQSMQFVRLVVYSTIEALELLINPGSPTFFYNRVR
ncbi:hypothetical protein DRP07_10770, partial [Archaeoglobales archaeon]